MPSKILDHRGNPIRSLDRGPRRDVRAKYDSAQTTTENRNWWANADGLSAREANSPEVRERLRNRCRYEAANNSWCNGIAATLADYLIGEGPKLQVLTGNEQLDRRIGEEWAAWADEVGLAEKLWLMRRARAVDGEAFALYVDNPRLDTPATLDLMLIEAEQVASPFPTSYADPLWVDGIEIDRIGNRLNYHVLKEHPGDATGTAAFGDYDRVPAESVIHWYRGERPGQFRGIPEFTPALDQFAQLRRYCLAIIAQAETLAELTVLLQSDLSSDTEEDDEDATNAMNVTPFTSTEIVRRMITTMPAGYDAKQLEPGQATTGYAEFVRAKIAELARCLQMPFAIAAGDYSQSNYSSGRLDVQNFHLSLKIDRSRLERRGLDRIFREWLSEMADRTDLIPADAGRIPHRWLWQGIPHVDPLKEANATAVLIGNYQTSVSEECAKQGVDADERFAFIAADIKRCEKFGLPNPYAQPMSAPGGSPQTKTREDLPPEDASAKAANGHARGVWDAWH